MENGGHKKVKRQETQVGRRPHVSAHQRQSICYGGGRLRTLLQGTPTQPILFSVTSHSAHMANPGPLLQTALQRQPRGRSSDCSASRAG